DPESGAAPGFGRGFDFYDADFHNSKPGEDRYQSLERRAEDVANHAMGWLSHHQQMPFFIWLHFYDAHEPYDPPEPFKSHFTSEPYDGEIAYTDSVVGSVLEVLQRHGLYKNTVIAVAADHGEAFGEHGEKSHGIFLYDETIHVPLLMKLPGEKLADKRVEARVALADVAPSLLQTAGISIPSTMQGQSLFPLLDAPGSVGSKQSKLRDRAIYSETDYAHRAFGWSELRSNRRRDGRSRSRNRWRDRATCSVYFRRTPEHPAAGKAIAPAWSKESKYPQFAATTVQRLPARPEPPRACPRVFRRAASSAAGHGSSRHTKKCRATSPHVHQRLRHGPRPPR